MQIENFDTTGMKGTNKTLLIIAHVMLFIHYCKSNRSSHFGYSLFKRYQVQRSRWSLFIVVLDAPGTLVTMKLQANLSSFETKTFALELSKQLTTRRKESCDGRSGTGFTETRTQA
ncbi:hypothetical protein T07_7394 [Trichinella nelsoni]|uniref:Uncharacterized protein n=1 Tax=Trichinella nelsoni TaxID=6336 RepID=A0A0V0S993_9BILA|nr:hypothetical protein T07_7394 [Trichinella nelsoni]